MQLSILSILLQVEPSTSIIHLTQTELFDQTSLQLSLKK